MKASDPSLLLLLLKHTLRNSNCGKRGQTTSSKWVNASNKATRNSDTNTSVCIYIRYYMYIHNGTLMLNTVRMACVRAPSVGHGLRLSLSCLLLLPAFLCSHEIHPFVLVVIICTVVGVCLLHLFGWISVVASGVYPRHRRTAFRKGLAEPDFSSEGLQGVSSNLSRFILKARFPRLVCSSRSCPLNSFELLHSTAL